MLHGLLWTILGEEHEGRKKAGGTSLLVLNGREGMGGRRETSPPLLPQAHAALLRVPVSQAESSGLLTLNNSEEGR